MASTSTTVTEKTRRVLQDLGLTDYEIKTYVTLLSNPGSQASDISRESDVPVSKIYEVLSNLERKGWVESQHSRPSKYFPKSPSTALQAFRLKLESDLKANEDYLLNELMPIYQQRATQERPDIWIVRGDFNILAKVSESINRCKKELLIVVPSVLNDVIEMIVPSLKSMKESGLVVRILMSGVVDTKIAEKVGDLAELRFKDNMFGGGVIVDAREVVLLLGGTPDDPSQALGIWSDHAGLSSFAKNYFEFLWAEAETPSKASMSASIKE
ncbi:MAG TPA: helix-turn-helix domain-containing protein [Nitrososphaerales archaeon]|nr:helix-turn-helix domain-containing protein [Nitrososphaerales archaeon]